MYIYITFRYVIIKWFLFLFELLFCRNVFNNVNGALVVRCLVGMVGDVAHMVVMATRWLLMCVALLSTLSLVHHSQGATPTAMWQAKLLYVIHSPPGPGARSHMISCSFDSLSVPWASAYDQSYIWGLNCCDLVDEGKDCRLLARWFLVDFWKHFM